MYAPLAPQIARTRAADARRAAHATEAGRVQAGPIVLRTGRREDLPQLARLAQLDGQTVPAQPVLVAEEAGAIRAALSLRDGRAIADPFVPSAELVEHLRLRAARTGYSPRRRRPRFALRWS